MTTKEFSELLGDFQKLANDNKSNKLEHHLSAKFSWIKVQMFDVLSLAENKGGLPLTNRIEIATDTLKSLQELVNTLEKPSEDGDKLY
tara:strand:- start:89 stop:352 length:264 start_codon:yes stop_codon:yes gene_type:complete